MSSSSSPEASSPALAIVMSCAAIVSSSDSTMTRGQIIEESKAEVNGWELWRHSPDQVIIPVAAIIL
jgi:hypothetical protein